MAFEVMPKTITAAVSPAYKRQVTEWQMINALLGGTGVMRAMGELYLPRHENESQKNYAKRLQKAVLAPFFKRAVNFSTGKAFFKPITIQAADNKSELSDKIIELVNDANKKGDSFAKFCNQAFKDAWAKGLGYIYVDAPSFDPNEVRTQAQVDAIGYRPYFVYIPAEDVLDIEIDEDGQIVYVKLLERFSEFNQSLKVTEEKTRIRVVTPNEIAVYERPMTAVTSASRQVKQTPEFTEYAIMPNYPVANKLNRVPLVPIYTGEKKADFECVSSLIDLAYTNVQYFQDESTHENAIQFAEFPLLILTGSDGKEITIGANKMIAIKDNEANLKYVEHSGKALEAGRLNLEDLRVKAGYCGLKVLMSDNANGKSANSTATEAEIENIDANSELKVASDNFVDSVNYALWLYELYLGTAQPNGQANFVAKLDGLYSVSQSDVRELAALMELKSAGEMRLETLYKEFKRRGTVSDDFDIESEVAFAEENRNNPEGV
ncbi:MAG: DUF4055 domain-containing protein [Candidatus Riflebacteria bacterium]|nr:DUF4055 domain-containing protein [Candidatus Riflebacteria bacterium]